MRSFFSPEEDFTKFFDIENRGITESERGIVELFVRTIKSTIENTDDSQLFNLTRTMQMMTGGKKEIASCLRNPCFANDESRQELAQAIQILTDEAHTQDIFRNSQYDNIRDMDEKLQNCDEDSKVVLRNFALRLMVDLVEKNYSLFNDDEKRQWSIEVTKEPAVLYANFHEIDHQNRNHNRLIGQQKRKQDSCDDEERAMKKTILSFAAHVEITEDSLEVKPSSRSHSPIAFQLQSQSQNDTKKMGSRS